MVGASAAELVAVNYTADIQAVNDMVDQAGGRIWQFFIQTCRKKNRLSLAVTLENRFCHILLVLPPKLLNLNNMTKKNKGCLYF